ncbi:MAG TPA: FtsW/RodA/SpoVE family cell cycle protein [Planctomycetaceae bacterium]
MTPPPAPFPLHRVPWLLIAAAGALMLVGLSAIERGDELAGGGATAEKQLVWVALGVPVLAAAAAVPYKSLLRFSYPLLAVTIVLLVAVYFTPPRNGARRWIPLGVFLLQPSEIAKLAFVLALATYLRFRENFRTLPGLVPPFLIALVPMGLILLEPDLGTSLLFVPVLGAMLFAAGSRPRHLALVGLLGVALLPVLWAGMGDYQKARVVAVFTQRDSGPAPRGHGYHLHQSKKVLALGGVWGSDIAGMPSSDPLDYHLPAGRTDFVFCLVGERWGLVGCGVTLALYALLFHRGVAVAVATKEPFGRLLVVGVVALVATQVAINTAMTVGLMPITGITLPLMSYGGSSLLSTLAALGLVVNVALRPGYEVGPMPFRFED